MTGVHGYYLEDLKVGMRESFEKTFTEKDVEQFAELSGDVNPVHLNDDFAATTMFKKRIVHGALTGSLISTVLGTKLPGPGAIFISQTMKFLAPVYMNDTVCAEVEILEINEEKRRVVFKVQCLVGEKAVLKGEAVIMVDRRD